MASARTQKYIKMLDARYGSVAAEAEEDVADYRRLTPAEDDLAVRLAARAAMQILRSRPDFAEAMAEVDPPASDYLTLTQRLMERRRASRKTS